MAESETRIMHGTVVYSSTGQRAYYLGPTTMGGAHVVEPEIGLYDEDTEEFGHRFEGVCVWPAVYLKAPKPVLDAELVEVRGQIIEAEQRLHALQATIRDAERDGKAMMARITKCDELKRLDDFIAGKITHLVISCPAYGVKIEAADTALASREDDDRYGSTKHKKLKLLTLYGGSNGSLAWMLSQYSDGSDNGQKHVIPCTSYEEALAEATGLLNSQFENLRKVVADRPWQLATPLGSAKALGIDAPADLTEALRAYQLKQALEQVTKTEAAFNTALASVEALQSKPKEAST